MGRLRYKRQKQQPIKPQENFDTQLFKKLTDNINNLKKMLDEPDDLITREMTVGQQNVPCAIVYIAGLVDRALLQNSILENLQRLAESETLPEKAVQLFDEIYQEFISVSNVEKGQTLDDVANGILSGKAVFYLDGVDTVFLLDVQGGETRAIEQSTSETVIRGPRSAFVESIGTNLSMVRRYVQDPNLRLKTYQAGRRNKQNLVVSYIDGIIHPDILKEVNRRLETMDVDDVINSGFIEQWIEDSFLSPFPQFAETERPDKVAAELLRGKLAIFLNGTPFVLIAPITLGDMLKSPEDYYERWLYTTLLRILRYIGAFLTLFLPALYISLVSFHQGLLPSKLAFSIAASREGVPFPPAVEAVLMVITLELLQEAGVRLPTPIGQTIGIVGGLVLGEAAVQAGIVSPVMIIVIALTAIAAFTMPTFSFGIPLRILRFAFMLAATIFGLYGIILVYIMINIHLVNLKSIGVPYSTPFAPTMLSDLKDLVIRAPVTMLKKRPEFLQTRNKKSMDEGEQ